MPLNLDHVNYKIHQLRSTKVYNLYARTLVFGVTLHTGNHTSNIFVFSIGDHFVSQFVKTSQKLLTNLLIKKLQIEVQPSAYIILVAKEVFLLDWEVSLPGGAGVRPSV